MPRENLCWIPCKLGDHSFVAKRPHFNVCKIFSVTDWIVLTSDFLEPWFGEKCPFTAKRDTAQIEDMVVVDNVSEHMLGNVYCKCPLQRTCWDGGQKSKTRMYRECHFIIITDASWAFSRWRILQIGSAANMERRLKTCPLRGTCFNHQFCIENPNVTVIKFAENRLYE